MKKSLIIGCICCVVFACVPYGNKENIRLMQQAQLFLDEKPDSALTLLDAVNTSTFGEAERAEYILLLVQAKNNAGMDVSTDVEIFQTRDYFIHGKDRKKAAYACFYAGLVLQMQGKEAEAVECYLKADDDAKHLSDNLLRGQIQNRIGDLNYKHELPDQALMHYMQANIFYKEAGNKQSEIGSMIKIGNCYLLTNQYDSAFAVYDRTEKLAYSVNDHNQWLAVLQNIGVAFMAEMYLTSLDSTNQQGSANLPMNFAPYLNTDLPDTAFIYGEKTLMDTNPAADNSMLLNLYQLMLLTEAQIGDGDKMVDYFKRLIASMNEILENREKESLMEIQKKYDFEKAQDEYAIKKRNYFIITLSALTTALCLTLWAFQLRKGKIQREHTIARLLLQLDMLRETEKQLQKLKEDETNDIETTNELKNRYGEQSRLFITQYFRVLSKIAHECKNASPDHAVVEIERLKRVLFGSSEIDFWTAAEKLIPPGLTEKMKKVCPELDNTEVKVCCLTYLNADIAAIAMALDVKDSTVYSVNSHIRGKLRIGDRKNIRKALEEKIS